MEYTLGMTDNTPKPRVVIIKARVPDFYEGADVAAIEVTEDLILMLDKRIAQTKRMFEQDFYGTRWWSYAPYFVRSAGPETFGIQMSEEDFEAALDANGWVEVPEDSDYDPAEDDYAPIDTLLLQIGAVLTANDTTFAGWQWTGYDKYIGDSARVTTYEMAEATVDEWAELIGCTEKLRQVRRLRGVR